MSYVNLVIRMSFLALICTFPLLISYLPPDQSLRGNLSSILSTVYCFGNLFFLGVAQRHVGKVCFRCVIGKSCSNTTIGQVSPAKRLHSSLLTLLVTALLTTYPALPALFPRLSSPLLLTALVFISLVLSFSTAYLQSSVFALSSLWGSEQTLGVMSGQGGIAVLVSGIQFVLAFVSAIAKSDTGQGDEGEEASKLAGVGLWAACSLGVVGCFMASRYLKRHPKYLDVLAPKFATSELNSVEGNKRESVTTRKLSKKNWELNLAVAWVFVVTLVRAGLKHT